MQSSHLINASKHMISLGLAVALLFGAHASGQMATEHDAQDKRETRWLQDLDYFAAQFPKRQKDFEKSFIPGRNSKAAWPRSASLTES